MFSLLLLGRPPNLIFTHPSPSCSSFPVLTLQQSFNIFKASSGWTCCFFTIISHPSYQCSHFLFTLLRFHGLPHKHSLKNKESPELPSSCPSLPPSYITIRCCILIPILNDTMYMWTLHLLLKQ